MQIRSFSSTMASIEGYKTTTALRTTSHNLPVSNMFSNSHLLIHWQRNTNAPYAKSSNDSAKSLPSSSKPKMENETAVSRFTTTATGKSNATAFKLVTRQSIYSDGASVCDHAQNWECHAAFVAVQSKLKCTMSAIFGKRV